MSLDTYANLKLEIASWLDRDDMTSQIDTFIDLAESRHKREVRIREMLNRSPLTVNDRYVSLPTDFLEMKTLRLLTDPVTVLTEINQHEMNRKRVETTGKPKFFTVHAQIEFDRSPDISYSGEIIFYVALTALSDANSSNAILTRVPDLYLYGALVTASPFIMDDTRIALWNQLYLDALNNVNLMDRKRAGPLVSRVVGDTP